MTEHPPLDQTVTNQLPIVSEALRVNITSPCWGCGTTGTYKATASLGELTRYFCHDSSKSCYNEWRGRYFADVKTDIAPIRIPRENQ